MASDYYLDGIAPATREVREWFERRFPVTPENLRDSRYIREKVRNRRNRLDLQYKVAERARLSVKWRNHLAALSGLSVDKVSLAGNRILSLLEHHLGKDGVVSIGGFGTFRLLKVNGKTKISFAQDRDWYETDNPPQAVDRLGFNYRIAPDGTIVPRKQNA
jgi:nucleoid DNA-binding protein